MARQWHGVVTCVMRLRRIATAAALIAVVSALTFTTVTAINASRRAAELEQDLATVRTTNETQTEALDLIAARLRKVDSHVGNGSGFEIDDLSSRVHNLESDLEELRNTLCNDIAPNTDRNFASLRIDGFFRYYVRC